ncbi:MAG: helix-turn-helix domain-containing protein [Pseudomonadota bacterium]
MVKKAAARRIPSQRRSAFTVRAILQASAELIVDEGIAKLGTNAVAERAGVSIGTLYQYFSNKEALAVGLRQQHERDVFDALHAAANDPAAATPEALLVRMIRANLDVHLQNPRLHRILTVEHPTFAPATTLGLCPMRAGMNEVFATTERRYRAMLPQVAAGIELRPMMTSLFNLVGSMTHALVVDCPPRASVAVLERIVAASGLACMDQFVAHQATTRPR